jgi:hypothetical protein
MSNRLGLIQEMKILRFFLILFFTWSVGVSVVLYFLVSADHTQVKIWEKQLEINKKFDGFVGYQQGFNKKVDDLVIVNLR